MLAPLLVARHSLDFTLTWVEPRTRGLISHDANCTVDARHPAAGNTEATATGLKELAQAADRLRAGRWDQAEAHSSVYPTRDATRRVGPLTR
ncbi:hypothetical protein ACI2LO_33140 [Streptomyces sp. NPDC033754]|uniref:hypothetical protein n=1 Tax=unclassified Streptomyces TaxID=2593676 RepID=UPI0033FF4EA7